MGCENVSKMISPSTKIEISAITKNGKTTIEYINVISGVGLVTLEEDEAEKKKVYKQLLENAKKAIPMLIDGIDCSSINYSDEVYDAEGKVTVMGTEMPYVVTIELRDTMADASSARCVVKIGDCSQALLQK